MRKVEVTIDINSSPKAIISAFTDPDKLRDWWNVEKTLINKKVGGLYTLTWSLSDKGFGYVSTGTIKEYHPDKILVIENFVYLNPEKSFLGPMTLTVRTKEKGNTTEVYLCQDGYQNGTDWDWYYNAVKQAWPTVMQTFKNYLEKK
jgi:uncharacterized protein YndB with AHSA1/START domain